MTLLPLFILFTIILMQVISILHTKRIISKYKSSIANSIDYLIKPYFTPRFIGDFTEISRINSSKDFEQLCKNEEWFTSTIQFIESKITDLDSDDYSEKYGHIGEFIDTPDLILEDLIQNQIVKNKFITKIKNNQISKIELLKLFKQIKNTLINKTEKFDKLQKIEFRGENEKFKHIVDLINKYLFKSKNSQTEYKVIQEITNQQLNSLQNQIKLNMPVPLYLGLCGTMLGIAMGISNITGDSGNLDSFTQHVQLAMIASITGILSVLVNNSIFYNKAKVQLEKNKSEFFSLIQTELIPTLSSGIEDSINKLSRQLDNFNEKFSVNINELDKSSKDIVQSANLQNESLKRIEELDVIQISQNNITLFKDLSSSAHSIEKFAQYLNQLNSFIDNTERLTSSSNELMTKVNVLNNNSEDLLSKIVNNTDESRKVIEWIQKHFSTLSEREDTFNESISNIDFQFRDGIQKVSDNQQKTLLEVFKNHEKLGSSFYSVFNDYKEKLDRVVESKGINTNNNKDLDKAIESLNDTIIGLKESIERIPKQNNSSKDLFKQILQYINQTSEKIKKWINQNKK